MDPITALEQHCATAWPALVDQPLGGWRLRAADGFTGRANSALTTGDPGVPLGEALEAVRAFAAGHGVPPLAHVVLGSEHEAGLAAAGWEPDLDHPGGVESLVMSGPLTGFGDARGGSTERDGGPVGGAAGAAAGGVARGGYAVSVPEEPDARWWELAAQPDPTPAQRRVLAPEGLAVGFGIALPVAGPSGSGSASGGAVAGGGGVAGGAAGGVVRGAVVGEVLHVARLAVRPEARRRGLARALVVELAAWGAARGATTLALQVAEHNKPAIALYESLGCAEHHRYRYWRPAS
ncbi:GNAT family N-acetyltransferase [Actinosynnema pretiosum]|uniref:GNAT family N-acetyltransferase n=1 Tax=Actinosynnema pretiosum TaxID=42197 RepID=A0A290ZG65_9PSEU|nr:GNAT family N-acetyltransferase [Actinosynnema pretiosum]ATE57974.1 GNAT family N-acetyltransferase [Actinosynnema pretiosum]